MILRDLVDEMLTWVQSRHFGKYRGIVVDNDDPAKLGRLNVQVPAVLGDIEVWAMPCVPYAGDGVGMYFIPEAGTGVWVEFEAGDPGYPIWAGCFWGDGQVPGDSVPGVKVLKTAAAELRIDDDGSEMKLEQTDGAVVTLTTDLVAEGGQATLKLEGSQASLEASPAKVELSGGAVSLNNGALEAR